MDDLEKVLYDEEALRKRISELGARISEDYRGKDLVLVGVFRGALMFFSDLSRAVKIPHHWDFVGASSYVGKSSSRGWVQITKDVEINIADKHVIVVEDIYDSGRTMEAIRDLLKVHRVASTEICCLLYKHTRERVAEIDIKYVGFELPDVFVVGYGLDYEEYYRNLPIIGVLKPSVYSAASED